jgi:hypothetical protein
MPNYPFDLPKVLTFNENMRPRNDDDDIVLDKLSQGYTLQPQQFNLALVA